MRTQLDLDLVRVVLTFAKRPVVDKNGDVVRGPKGAVELEENTSAKEYMVFDTHPKAPKGFALKVSAKSKSYLIQKRVGSRVIKTKLGDIKEFKFSQDAYDAGFKALETIRATGKNPNTIRKDRQLDEYTLREVFDYYRDYLVNERRPPAKANSLLALDKAIKKFSPWLTRRVVDITTDEIKARFKLLFKDAPTATEQAFRWASAAVDRKILNDKLAAASKGTLPAIIQNPFEILTLNNMYRDRNELEEEYKRKRVRNPLNVMAGGNENLSVFLNTLWDKRGLRRTACDYLLLGLLWGCRKNEHAPLQWREKLSNDDATTNSWVDVKSGEVFFFNTKNGVSHTLPLGPFVKKLLEDRQVWLAELQDQERLAKRGSFVFPAESPNSNLGYYSSPQEMLKSIREDAGIEKLTMHDLRRTVGRICELLDFSENMIRTILNHGSSAVTTRYTEAEWKRVIEHVERLEQEVMRRCPRMWNALRPLTLAPLELTEWEPKPLRNNKAKHALEEATA
jgi:integrase